MNDKSLPFKLLSNEQDKLKCKGHPRKSWLAPVVFLKERIGHPRQSLNIKLIKKALDKRECEKNLEYVEGAPSRCFKRFVCVTKGCLRSQVSMQKEWVRGVS